MGASNVKWGERHGVRGHSYLPWSSGSGSRKYDLLPCIGVALEGCSSIWTLQSVSSSEKWKFQTLQRDVCPSVHHLWWDNSHQVRTSLTKDLRLTLQICWKVAMAPSSSVPAIETRIDFFPPFIRGYSTHWSLQFWAFPSIPFLAFCSVAYTISTVHQFHSDSHVPMCFRADLEWPNNLPTCISLVYGRKTVTGRMCELHRVPEIRSNQVGEIARQPCYLLCNCTAQIKDKTQRYSI